MVPVSNTTSKAPSSSAGIALVEVEDVIGAFPGVDVGRAHPVEAEPAEEGLVVDAALRGEARVVRQPLRRRRRAAGIGAARPAVELARP